MLEISKYLMYDYHYNVMQKHYDDKIELMYTDTGKLLLIYYFSFIGINLIYYFRFIGILYSN